VIWAPTEDLDDLHLSEVAATFDRQTRHQNRKRKFDLHLHLVIAFYGCVWMDRGMVSAGRIKRKCTRGRGGWKRKHKNSICKQENEGDGSQRKRYTTERAKRHIPMRS